VTIQAILFDCDGTLVDSEVLGNRVLVEYVAEFGLELRLEDVLERFVGRKMSDCVSEIEAHLGYALPEHFVPEFRRRMAQAFESELEPVTGAHEMLESLTIPFCIASSGPREKMAVSLRKTGLDAFFPQELIFSAYDIGTWKPDPGLFLHAAQQMGVAPEQCLVVEDSVHGVTAGAAAGMCVVAFSLQEERARLHGADHCIQALSELLSLLVKLSI
jgi:HAD superfamily hydrolase (TIGR01509 family)